MEPRKHERARIVGRYAIYGEIAAGGMATVHFGRLLGPVGFSRTVAVKRLHARFTRDPEFVAMFIDEARLAARIRHPNVVQTLDVVATEGELFLVMDYVQGESLARLVGASRKEGGIPIRIAASILCGAMHGLHAAHEATDEHGEALGMVHRDMSPQNILAGADGIARVLDFGVAMAAGRAQATGPGKMKGKLGYMAPEQIEGRVTRQSDVFSASIVLWEILTGRRLFPGDDPRQVLGRIMTADITPPTAIAPHLPPGVDAIVLGGLQRDPRKRYATAREMALDLEGCLGLASPTQVGDWVESMARTSLAKRAAAIADIESSSSRVIDVTELTGSSAETVDPAYSPSGVIVGPLLVRSDAPRDAIPVSFERAPSRQRRLLWILAAVVALAIVGLVVSVGWIRAAAPPAPSAIAAPASAPSPLAAPEPAASAPSPPSAPPPPSDPPASAESAAAPASSPIRAAPVVKRAAPPLDCDPPYSLDAQGHKHWKEACFRK